MRQRSRGFFSAAAPVHPQGGKPAGTGRPSSPERMTPAFHLPPDRPRTDSRGPAGWEEDRAIHGDSYVANRGPDRSGIGKNGRRISREPVSRPLPFPGGLRSGPSSGLLHCRCQRPCAGSAQGPTKPWAVLAAYSRSWRPGRYRRPAGRRWRGAPTFPAAGRSPRPIGRHEEFEVTAALRLTALQLRRQRFQALQGHRHLALSGEHLEFQKRAQ